MEVVNLHFTLVCSRNIIRSDERCPSRGLMDQRFFNKKVEVQCEDPYFSIDRDESASKGSNRAMKSRRRRLLLLIQGLSD